jgi:hypothetical protein
MGRGLCKAETELLDVVKERHIMRDSYVALFTVYFPASKNCNCELALKNSKTPN